MDGAPPNHITQDLHWQSSTRYQPRPEDSEGRYNRAECCVTCPALPFWHAHLNAMSTSHVGPRPVPPLPQPRLMSSSMSRCRLRCWRRPLGGTNIGAEAASLFAEAFKARHNLLSDSCVCLACGMQLNPSATPTRAPEHNSRNTPSHPDCHAREPYMSASLTNLPLGCSGCKH
jgi:hypothetical protein